VEETGVADALELTGMPQPDMYSPELSLFVLEAGIKLLAERRPDILYLSLTDYVQHKYAPGEPEADRYYKNMDDKFGALEALGAVVALTADHGMNDKSNPDGSPKVIWLQDLLDARFGRGKSIVICPITDRFVAHHGALGGFVRVYCQDGLDRRNDGPARELPGVQGCMARPRPRPSSRWTARATSWSSATPAPASAPPRRTTTSPASRAIASAPTAASPRAGCRSS
jgi:phosphonoacetate hydrolase